MIQPLCTGSGRIHHIFGQNLFIAPPCIFFLCEELSCWLLTFMTTYLFFLWDMFDTPPFRHQWNSLSFTPSLFSNDSKCCEKGGKTQPPHITRSVANKKGKLKEGGGNSTNSTDTPYSGSPNVYTLSSNHIDDSTSGRIRSNHLSRWSEERSIITGTSWTREQSHNRVSEKIHW